MQADNQPEVNSIQQNADGTSSPEGTGAMDLQPAGNQDEPTQSYDENSGFGSFGSLGAGGMGGFGGAGGMNGEAQDDLWDERRLKKS